MRVRPASAACLALTLAVMPLYAGPVLAQQSQPAPRMRCSCSTHRNRWRRLPATTPGCGASTACARRWRAFCRACRPSGGFGLITYGPGSRPACVNVSLELRPAPNAAPQIMSRVDRLKPDGKTPLTRAVRMAADALDYRNRPGTIVLLTDGEETCGASPCALAKTLKADGAHTTVHVISYRIASASDRTGCSHRAVSPMRRAAYTWRQTPSTRSPLLSKPHSPARS